MPPAERRIIHIALRDHPAVTTESAGEEPYRKVVIYPNLSRPLPLTPLTELDKVLPEVAAKLDADGMWTREAEDELLRVML